MDLNDEFKELDDAGEFRFFALALRRYFEALVKVGFTDEQAFDLVAAYSKFIYDMGIEEFINEKYDEHESRDNDSDDDDVDPELNI